MQVDLNADLGESYGQFVVGDDEKLMQVVTSANVACGFHAGDYMTIPKSIQLAKEAGVAIGAHPGYPDLQGFGRRLVSMSDEEIYQMVVYQIGVLQTFCHVEGVQLNHVKPHGALYNLAAKDRKVADAIVKAIVNVDERLVLYGLANGELIRAGRDVGLQVASEVFADRTYTSEGHLTPRSERDAILKDRNAIRNQVFEMVLEGKVTTSNGNQIDIEADTVCFHGDGESAYEHVKHIRESLEYKGIQVIALSR
nr:5-oxoprolinase subunit PxpA [Alkalibacillus aidingensis]